MQTRDIVIELLSQLGSSREAREYLRKFSSKDTAQFAVIKVGGEIIRHQLDQLASAIGFLHHVGLFPIILHGAGAQLNEALEQAGIQAEKIDGVRVTTAEAMSVVRPVIYRQNHKLVEALEQLEIRTRPLQHGVFECEYEDQQKLGLVGRVTQVHLEGIRSAVASGALPIVTCLGESSGGQVMNINADVAARKLVTAIEPQKIIFLSPTGGLLDQNDQVISAINLETDYERMMNADWVHSGMRLKLQQINQLLNELPQWSSVSITSAKNLTRELFTHRGAGTLIRRGEGFNVQTEWNEKTKAEFKLLMKKCFDRVLIDSYFDDVPMRYLIRANSGRAAAVIAEGRDSTAYMDKFAVTPTAQGEGIGAALWFQIRNRFEKLYWRSRQNNPINSWYLKHSDFSVRRGIWQVFGYGVGQVDKISELVENSAARPECWTNESN